MRTARGWEWAHRALVAVLGLVALGGTGCSSTLSEEETGPHPEQVARQWRLSASIEGDDASWMTTGNLAQGRVLHTAAPLPGGRVLIAGGYNRTSEVYDPATGTWTRTGDTLISRRAHSMTTLRDGRVLMVGGEDCQASTSAEVYNPATGAWTATGALGACRASHASALLPSGRVLVVGGTDSAGRVLASAEVYDPDTGTWTATGALGTARAQPTATLLTSGRVLVAGGDNGGLLASAEVYDPDTGTWTATGGMGQPRRYHTATLLPSGEVLVTGGGGGERGPAASAEVYDPDTGTWTATGAMGQPRRYHTATLLPSGEVLVTGGYHEYTGISSTSEVYDPGAKTWSAAARLNVGRYGHTLTQLKDGRVLVAGGFSTQDQSSAEQYVSPRSFPDATKPSGTSLLLQVLDASGQPIPSAAISFGDELLPTDGVGRLLLQQLPPGRFTTRVDVPGYASAAVSVDLSEGLHAGAQVRLLPVGTSVPFLAENGVSVQHQGVSVTLPANAVADVDGQPVSGPVQLQVTPLDPTLALAALPGPLEGVVSSSGERVSMESIFMAEVSLKGGNDQPLQIAPGAHATLEFPLPEALASHFQPGDTIPAWWLDLDRGLWVKEGAGTVRTTDDGRAVWVVEVAHFTWWNADVPISEKSCVHVTVLDEQGQPVVGVPVVAEGKDYAGSRASYTGPDGSTCVEVKLGGTADVHVGYLGTPVGEVWTVTGSAAGVCGSASCQSHTLIIPHGPICTPGASASCPYSGPSGVGICRAGTNTCDPLGMSWSGCQGQVLPSPAENCGTPFDDNCNGTINEACGRCTFRSTELCYGGPEDTLCPEGTSCPHQWCSAGTRTCDRFGSFGPCLGQRLPQAKDTCDTTVDDDCDGSTECNDIHVWSRRFGDAACQGGQGVEADAAGNVVISGYFNGTVNFGGAPLTSVDSTDAFVAKLDGNGNHVWSHRLGNLNYAVSLDVTTDGAGNTVVSGVFYGTLKFDNQDILTSTGDSDSFVVKLAPDGTLLNWTAIGGAKHQEVWGMAVDSQGDVLVAGRNWGTLNVNGTLYPTAGGADAFVVKLRGSDLSPLWAHNWGSAAFDSVEGVDVDTANNVLLTGRFSNTVNFGGLPLISLGDTDAYVVKLSATGTHLWSKSFGAPGMQVGSDVQTDGANNVVVTGGFEGNNVSFGGPPLPNAGDMDIFLLKMDANGNHLWSKSFGGPNTDAAEALAVASNGSIAITGELVGPTDFGGGPRTGHGGYDSFVARFDQDGTHHWSQVHGDITTQAGLGIAFDSAGNALVIGELEGRARFGQDASTELVSNGCSDIFLLKLRSTP
ncbi:kelch repeat-containing protein [Vitiosangium sp. GDMCC 1.1324]|uniref:kelch repeat-containing protein n=1 Tax=Vitiosangium sp. (strain GDMCC 1.1324) TaxID=2138576 RepID=UPI00130E20AB|nr:kelch repeat-containing protein [Vitiosangium sp. GDMCC 1.1324]